MSVLDIAGAWMLSSGCIVEESESRGWNFSVAWADGSCDSQQKHSTQYPLHHVPDLRELCRFCLQCHRVLMQDEPRAPEDVEYDHEICRMYMRRLWKLRVK